MPIGPQALEDVGEMMPSLPATFKDPGTLDQIVLYQHSLTHFPSQLRCHVCVESRGREFRSREQSKFDSVVPQLQFDYGYMGTEAFCRLHPSSWEQTPLLEPYTRHLTWCLGQRNGCVIGSMNASLYKEKGTSSSVAAGQSCPNNVVLMDKADKFYTKCYRHRVIRATAPRRKPSPKCAVLPAHIWQLFNDKFPFFGVTTHSPMLPWTIRDV